MRKEVVDEDITVAPLRGFSDTDPDRIVGDFGSTIWPRGSRAADVLEKLLEAQNPTVKEIPDV